MDSGKNIRNDITVGLEIEPSVNFIPRDSEDKSYAYQVTLRTIAELREQIYKRAGVQIDTEKPELAFAYLIDHEGRKLLGVYYDTAPMLKVNEAGEITAEHFVTPKTGIEIKSEKDALISIHEVVDEQKLDNTKDNIKSLVLNLKKIENLNDEISAKQGCKWVLTPNIAYIDLKDPTTTVSHSGRYKTDINLGVPIDSLEFIKTIEAPSLPEQLVKFKDQPYSQNGRIDYPIKTPSEFLSGEIPPQIVPPTGVSYSAVEQRIAHLKYIQKELESGTIDLHIEQKGAINQVIEQNLSFYTQVYQHYLSNSEGLEALSKDSNAFSTPHHTNITLEDRILFEMRDGYLEKVGAKSKISTLTETKFQTFEQWREGKIEYRDKHLKRAEKNELGTDFNLKEALLKANPGLDVSSLSNFLNPSNNEIKPLTTTEKAGKVTLVPESDHIKQHGQNIDELMQKINNDEKGTFSSKTVIVLERKQDGKNLGMEDVKLLAGIIQHNEMNKNDPTKIIAIPEEIKQSPIYKDAELYNVASKKGITVLGAEGKALKGDIRDREEHMSGIVASITAQGKDVVYIVGESHVKNLKTTLEAQGSSVNIGLKDKKELDEPSKKTSSDRTNGKHNQQGEERKVYGKFTEKVVAENGRIETKSK